MERGWNTTIFTGLYTLALILTWVSLFAIERFAATDLRAWAPFFQGAITAAAIGSAWFLHDTKRRHDLADAQASLSAAYKALSYSLEDWAGFIDDAASKGAFDAEMARLNIEPYRDELGVIRRLPLEKLGDPTAVMRAQLFVVGCRQFLSEMEQAQSILADNGELAEDHFSNRITSLVNRRNRLLGALGQPSEQIRLRRWPRAKAHVAPLHDAGLAARA